MAIHFPSFFLNKTIAPKIIANNPGSTIENNADVLNNPPSKVILEIIVILPTTKEITARVLDM